MGYIAVFHQVTNGGPHRGEPDTGPRTRPEHHRSEAKAQRGDFAAAVRASSNLEVAYLDALR